VTQLTLIPPLLTAQVLAIEVPVSVPPGSDKVTTLLGYVLWGGGICAFLGILVCAYQFMLSPNRHQNDGMSGLGKVGAGMILLGVAAPAVTAILGV
jgi:hypothetical protein